MGNTTHGIPWPAGTDLLRDGDNAIKAAADKVDLLIPYSLDIAAGVRQRAAMMTSTIAVTFNASGRCVIDFSATFSDLKFVNMISTTYPFMVAIPNLGSPVCEFFARYDQTALVTGTVTVFVCVVGALK